jgi:hypothetical protein
LGVGWYWGELRASHLLGRWSTTSATHTPALFSMVIFETGSQFLSRLAWITILLVYGSHSSWDDRHAPPCSAFFFEMGFHKLFFFFAATGLKA